MPESPRDDNPSPEPLHTRGDPSASPDPQRIGLSLTGALPCYICSYNLQGLSVTSSCPECGAAVRATILYRVDPEAEAFQPLYAPRLTALGLVMWGVFGFLCVCLCWSPRVIDIVERFITQRSVTAGAPLWVPRLIVVFAALSALGAIALIRPTRAAPIASAFLAGIGVLAFAPLAWALWQIHGVIDPTIAAPYFVASPRADRTMMRLLVGAALLVMILCVRPNARRLVQRSLTLRKGRVDRQTLLGLSIAVVIAMLGDALWLLSHSCPPSFRDLVTDFGTILIAIGSLLFTIGTASAVADSWRIAKAMLIPAPSLKQVLGRAGDVGAPPEQD